MSVLLLNPGGGGYEYNEPHGQAISFVRSEAFKKAMDSKRYKKMESTTLEKQRKEWYTLFKNGVYKVPKFYLDKKGWVEQSYAAFKESPQRKESLKKRANQMSSAGERLKRGMAIYKKLRAGEISTKDQQAGESLRKFAFRLAAVGAKPAPAPTEKKDSGKKAKAKMKRFWGRGRTKSVYRKSESVDEKFALVRARIDKAPIPDEERKKLRKEVAKAEERYTGGADLKVAFGELEKSFAELGYNNLNPVFPFVSLNSWTGGANVAIAVGSTHVMSNFVVKKVRENESYKKLMAKIENLTTRKVVGEVVVPYTALWAASSLVFHGVGSAANWAAKKSGKPSLISPQGIQFGVTAYVLASVAKNLYEIYKKRGKGTAGGTGDGAGAGVGNYVTVPQHGYRRDLSDFMSVRRPALNDYMSIMPPYLPRRQRGMNDYPVMQPTIRRPFVRF